MNIPSFEPHFSAEHLSRKIRYLETELASLPKGSIISRNGNKYVRLYESGGKKSTVEKKLDSPEGNKAASIISLRQSIIDDLNTQSKTVNELYPGMTVTEPPTIIRSTPIPKQMTLDYYDNPPDVVNPYPNHGYVLGDIAFKSRFELIAAQAIKGLGLPFKSEVPIQTASEYFLFMDMMIPVPERGRCVGFEFCGMMDNHKYMHDIQAKMISYADLGMVPYHDVFYVFGGEKWLPTIRELQSMIIFAVENC